MSEAQPLYARVKEHIRDNIRSGAWGAGHRVPSENELVESFRISRMTANRALRELTAEGFLSRVPGVGTFVKEAPALSRSFATSPRRSPSAATAMRRASSARARRNPTRPLPRNSRTGP